MKLLPKDLLYNLLTKYGEDEQLRQAMGECGELIAACQNYHRAQTYGHRTETLSVVIEEAVDVFFMTQQIRILNPEYFDELCDKKLKKVLAKFKNEVPIKTKTDIHSNNN
jgi:hypothetical protein